jgi:hypothetical protein
MLAWFWAVTGNVSEFLAVVAHDALTMAIDVHCIRYGRRSSRLCHARCRWDRGSRLKRRTGRVPRWVEDRVGCDMTLIDLMQRLVPVRNSLGLCATSQRDDLELNVGWEASTEEVYKGYITNIGGIGFSSPLASITRGKRVLALASV